MTGLDLFLAIAGAVVTAMVVVGMILLVPRNDVPVSADDTDYHGSPATGAERSAPQRPVAEGS